MDGGGAPPAYETLSSARTAVAGPARSDDRIERLTHGERWFLDGFAVAEMPGGVLGRQIDMSVAQRAIEALRSRGVRATYTHVLVRAVALALRRYPEGRQMVAGYQRLQPGSVDIGLSVAGQTSYAPVLVIKDADERPLPALVDYLTEAARETREKEQRDLEGMHRTGWIIPIGAARRLILRWLNRTFWFRRRLVGIFQITCLPGTDWVAPLTFYSGMALGFGQVRDTVLAIDGQPAVRPASWLTLSFDHKAHDGQRVMALLRHIEEALKSDELLLEANGGLPALPRLALASVGAPEVAALAIAPEPAVAPVSVHAPALAARGAAAGAAEIPAASLTPQA